MFNMFNIKYIRVWLKLNNQINSRVSFLIFWTSAPRMFYSKKLCKKKMFPRGSSCLISNLFLLIVRNAVVIIIIIISQTFTIISIEFYVLPLKTLPTLTYIYRVFSSNTEIYLGRLIKKIMSLRILTPVLESKSEKSYNVKFPENS